MEDFNFGENLRIIRQAKGISQDAMAIGLGMSQSKYSKLERNSNVPALDLVKKIAHLLEIEPPILLSGRSLEDLVPKIDFERQAKAIMNTRTGIGFFWILVIPSINASYDVGNSFCLGLGTSDEVRIVVRFITGFAAIIFAYNWMRRIQKGKD